MADTSGSESSFGGMELLQALRRRYYVILAAVAVSVSMSVLVARSRPEKYRATARILIEPRRSRFSSAESEAGTMALYFFYTKELQTQRLMIKSKPVAERLVEKLGAERLGLREGADPAEEARGLYEAEPVRETRFIDVSCLATDPELAAEIANAVADAYIEEALRERQRLLNETMAAYSRRVPERLEELEKAEADLLNFKEEHNIVSSDKPEEALRREELDLIEQLSQARQERMSCQSKLKAQSANGVIGSPHKDIARGVAGDDAWVRQVLEKRLVQRALLTELARSYSEGHPKLESAKTAMAEIQRELDEAARSYYERLHLKYDAAVWKENDTERLLAGHRERIVRMSKLLSRYENLQQRRDSLRALLEPVARSQAELDFIANLNLPSASVTERASPPFGPCEPSVPKYVLVGLVLGLLLGFALARLIESADQSVRTPDDLTRAAPVKVPGVVSHIKRDVARNEHARALATADRSASVIAEQFRSLRTGLTTMEPWGKKSPHGVVLVTSSGLSEGKTTVCFNTAEAFAQLGKPVVIVDADLRRPKGHDLMGVSRSPGVVEVLEGECELSGAVRESPVPDLFILPAGRRTSRPAELMASDGMRDLLNELRRSYSITFVDSPPVVPVADARSLAAEADLVLLVVRSGHTNRRALARTYELLGGGNGVPIAAVLNGLMPSVEKAYGYGDRRYRVYYRSGGPGEDGPQDQK